MNIWRIYRSAALQYSTNEWSISKYAHCVDMAPFYEHVCEDCKIQLDKPFLDSLSAQNELTIKALDAKIEDAQKNAGETEVSDALIEKAQYLAKIGDKVRQILILCTSFSLYYFARNCEV
jgi:hypothetical protein